MTDPIEAPPGQPPGGVGLRRLDHVGVAVPDLDAAIAHYTRVFGMRCVHRETNQEQGVEEAMLAVGPEPADPAGAAADAGGCLQLLAPLRPDSPVGKFLARHGPGVQQIAYAVTDLAATCARLREAGVRLLYEEPRQGTGGSRINFVHPKDGGGVLVELVEPASP